MHFPPAWFGLSVILLCSWLAARARVLLCLLPKVSWDNSAAQLSPSTGYAVQNGRMLSDCLQKLDWSWLLKPLLSQGTYFKSEKSPNKNPILKSCFYSTHKLTLFTIWVFVGIATGRYTELSAIWRKSFVVPVMTRHWHRLTIKQTCLKWLVAVLTSQTWNPKIRSLHWKNKKGCLECIQFYFPPSCCLK